jgi:hypothetical protein
VGDVNGDGYDDVIVGSFGYGASIYHGSASGIVDGSTADTTLPRPRPRQGVPRYFGYSVAGAGDVNADGYDDVAVVARDWAGPENDEGAALIFYGSSTGIASGDVSTADLRVESNRENAHLITARAAGDVNGDGVDDLIVGAYGYSQPGSRTQTGAAFILNGVAPPVLDVEIDIKPGSDPNPVNPMAKGIIPVAILGSETFDVADVDVATLAFGPEGAAPAHEQGGHPRDVNGDGLTDLLSHYRTEETGIALGDTEACVTGETLDGIPFEGCDDISTEPPCGNGYAAALVVPPLVWIGRRRRRTRA